MGKEFERYPLIILLLGVSLTIPNSFCWAQSVSKTVRISFEIEPITVLKVTSEKGVGAVQLGPVSPHAEVSSQALEISVTTNTHGRYQVYHELRNEILNAAGTSFPNERLLFMVTPGTEGGNSEIPNMTPVPMNEALIFTSKAGGGSDTFRVLYSIDNSKLFSAGTYYGNIFIDLRNE